MRVLWVKSGGLLPLDTGGKIRSYNILKQLASRHETDLFTFYPEQANDQHASLESVCARVFAMPMKLPVRASLGDCIDYARNLFSLRPHSMTKYCRPEVARRLRQLLTKEKYDAILCDFLLTAAVIPWDIPCPKIIFTHNVEAVIWRRHFEVSRNPLFRAVAWREYRTMAHVEKMYLQQADHVLTVSENDKREFSSFLDPAKITVIQTGVDVGYFSPQSGEEPATLVFTGSMDWLPNQDGIGFFAEEVLPLVRRQFPAVKLCVVGRSPSEALKRLAAKDPGIEITGRVEDVRPSVARGTVYIVPLRIGGGTRIKIFEAMAMGKAVVSTTVGAEGLPVEHGKNIVLADEPARFAQEICGLIADADRRRRLALAARELVESYYSWAAVSEQLLKVLDSLSGQLPESLTASAVTSAS